MRRSDLSAGSEKNRDRLNEGLALLWSKSFCDLDLIFLTKPLRPIEQPIKRCLVRFGDGSGLLSTCQDEH